MKCYQSSYTSYASSAAALQEPREGLGAVQQAHLFYWPSVVRVDSETIIFLHFCILSRLGLLAAHFYCAIYSVSKVEIASEMNQTGVVKGVGKTNCRLLSTMVTTSVGSEPAIAPACLSSPRSSRDAWIRKCARVCVEQGLINRIYTDCAIRQRQTQGRHRRTNGVCTRCRCAHVRLSIARRSHRAHAMQSTNENRRSIAFSATRRKQSTCSRRQGRGRGRTPSVAL